MERPSRLSCQFLAQRVAFERPNLVAGIAPCDLLANFNIEVLRAGRRAFPCHREAVIQAKGLNAPRLSPEKIDAVITGEDYHVFPGTTLTVCCLKLKNGFTVTGESAAASPENFDVEIGKKIARSNARDKIWALEGYALREKLAA